jgi:hypothetical protein
MSSGKKDFDAVTSMRVIRDRLSAEIDGMTFDEEVRWLASRELSDPFLKRLQKRLPNKHLHPTAGASAPDPQEVGSNTPAAGEAERWPAAEPERTRTRCRFWTRP